MTDELKKRLKAKSEPPAFKKTHGLWQAVTLGVGSLMGAGVYVLVGLAAQTAGPAIWISYAVCGVLTFLSVLMYCDLSKNLSSSGGGYLYAYSQLGAFWGFLVGWHLALGSVFACALYATGFSAYLSPLLPFGQNSPWVQSLLSSLLVVALISIGLKGGKGGDRVQKYFTWGNLVILAVLCIVAIPSFDSGKFVPMLPKGLSGVGVAISIIYISFFGYQLIANSSEEIVDAKSTVPKAMKISMVIALVFYLLVAVVSIAAVGADALAGSSAPLVLVAQTGFGRFGGMVISIGGILASVAALNGTLLSQGRQIYAMGRDRLLPDVLGYMSKRTQIPSYALLVGAGGAVVVLWLADLAFIAKAANFSLLFSMLPVSMALHKLHRKRTREGAVFTKWQRFVPFGALAANGALLLTLDGQSLTFGGTIVAVGCLVFFGYSYSTEKRGRAGLSVDLADEQSGFDLLGRGEKVLVPLANPQTSRPLFSIAQALVPPVGGEIMALSIVQSDNPKDALKRDSSVEGSLETIERIRSNLTDCQAVFRPIVRAAKRLSEGIVHAAQEERAKIVVMGWSAKEDGNPSRLLEEVSEALSADLVFLDRKDNRPFKRIGVSLGSRDNLPLMVRVASALCEQSRGKVSYINVMPEHYEKKHVRHAREIHIEAIERHESIVPFSTEILCSDNPLEALVNHSRGLDLIVVGAGQVNAFEKKSVGAFSSMVVDQAHCSVVVIRRSSAFTKMLPAQVDVIRDLTGSIKTFGRKSN